MKIQINQTLEFTDEDAKKFIELIHDAVMSSESVTDKFSKPLSELFKRAKITSITDLSDITLDCGNAQE